MQIVTFRIGRERFALPTGSAREVILYEVPRRLPGSQKWVDGVINLRGEIIPVCDLLVALGIDGVTTREQIIVCDAPDGSLGLIVEEVTSVIRVKADEDQASRGARPPGTCRTRRARRRSDRVAGH